MCNDEVVRIIRSGFDETLQAFKTDTGSINGQWVTETVTFAATDDHFVSCDGYNAIVIDIIISDTASVTVLSANASAGVPASSATYTDISQYGVEILTDAATAAAYTDTLTTL